MKGVTLPIKRRRREKKHTDFSYKAWAYEFLTENLFNIAGRSGKTYSGRRALRFRRADSAVNREGGKEKESRRNWSQYGGITGEEESLLPTPNGDADPSQEYRGEKRETDLGEKRLRSY